MSSSDFPTARDSARRAHRLTLRDAELLAALNGLSRLNVGHSLVAWALMVGFAPAVKEWIDMLSGPGAVPDPPA